MFEEAFKKVPTNEDMGAQTFFANIRTANWKSGQQVLICAYNMIFICVIALDDRLRRGCLSNSKMFGISTGVLCALFFRYVWA
jgi:hypothetical protein